MEKVKPNKFAECLKATEQFGIEVPNEITKVESERFYHLLLVEEVHRPRLKKYDKRVSIIKLNQTDYITKIKGASTKGSRSNVMALLVTRIYLCYTIQQLNQRQRKNRR